MNCDLVQPKIETDDLLLSITKNWEKKFDQNHSKPKETLESKLTKPKETFFFQPSRNFGIDSKWMLGLTNLEAYNSIFNLTEEINKVELYTVILMSFLLQN